MRIASTFSIPAEPARVFDAILDEATMQRCIFGCEELERVDETHYRGRLVDEIARVRFNTSFGAEIVEIERPHRIHAVLTGEDRKLASSVKLTAALVIEAATDSESSVHYEMDLALWGRIGRLGEPIVRRRSQEAERHFVSSLRAAFHADTPAAAPSAAEAPDPLADRPRSAVWRALRAVAVRVRAATHARRHRPA